MTWDRGDERYGKYEKYAYILDYLPHGRAGAPISSQTSVGVLQIVGESYLTLLEALPRKDAEYHIRDRIYVGKAVEERESVSRVLGRVSYDELTSQARAELPAVLEEIVTNNEAAFIRFFNKSQPVTLRMHSLELIPGIGKGLMSQIIDQRERAMFQGFEDLKSRVNIRQPRKLIARRMLQELKGDEKYSLFTRPNRYKE